MDDELSRDEPDDASMASTPEADIVPSVEMVEAIAMEAVTVPVISSPTMTAGSDEDSPSDSGPVIPGEPDPMVGRRIGPYELTERIGGGGMGTVYRAVRVEDFRQDVAVKLIGRGTDSDAIVRRFRAESHVQAASASIPISPGSLTPGRPRMAGLTW